MGKLTINGPFIVDLPIENGWIFHSYVNVYKRVQETFWIFLAHRPKTPPIYAPNDVDIPY